MKKKLTLTLLALVCALCCAFSLAACGDKGANNSVTGTIATLPEHVSYIYIDSSAYNNDGGRSFSGTKNTELEIRVELEYCYDIGTLKMLINGAEAQLTPHTDEYTNNVVEGMYSCKYTPTADFEITFDGEAKLAERKVTLGVSWFHYDYWQNDPEYSEGYKAQQRLIKEEIKDSVRVKVLVNDQVKAPFNGITVEAFENLIKTGPDITVNAKDKVEVRFYTTNAKLIPPTTSDGEQEFPPDSMIYGEVEENENSMSGSGFKNLDDLIDNRFEEHDGEKASYLKISSCERDEIITFVPLFYFDGPALLGRTFVLSDITAYQLGEGGEEKPAPEPIASMAEKWEKDNLGKTAVCTTDGGKVLGTCNFDFGAPFDELTGDRAFTLTVDEDGYGVTVANNAGMELIGRYEEGTLTLNMTEPQTGSDIRFTFVLKA